MKSKLFLTFPVLLLTVLLFSCQSSGTKDKKVATIDNESIDVDKLKTEIVEIIMSLPDNSETVSLINETGAAYIGGLTSESLNTDNLLTRAANAKAFGGVLFDMAYSNTYNQVNTFSKLLDINDALIKKLGFSSFVKEQEKYAERYNDSKEDRDSVDIIVSELLAASNDFIQENGSATDISLVFAGATSKSLYVISSVTLLAMNNDKLVELMKDQKERLTSAIKILELAGDDQEVVEMSEALKPVLDVYAAEGFGLDQVEQVRELTSFVMQ